MPRWSVGLVALAGVTLLIFALPSWSSVVDDAYISARYAEHLAAGHGLVYNAGETPVEGVTNLAFTSILALGLRAGVGVHALMTGLGAFFGVASVVALAGLTAALLPIERRYLACVPALLLAADPHLHVVSTNGLESTMFLAGVLGVLWGSMVAVGPWRWPMGLALGLLGAVRPEGLAVGLGVLLFDAIARRTRLRELGSWAYLVGVLGAQVPLLAWRLHTYGELVPNTAHAKAAYGMGKLLRLHIVYFGPDAYYWIPLVLMLLVVPFFSAWTLRKGLVLSITVGLVAVASTVYLWMPGGRLLLPSVALIYALAILPLAQLEGGRAKLWAAGVVAWALLLVASPMGANVSYSDWRHSLVPGNAAIVAGEHLSAHAPDGAWLATRDAGALAWSVGPEVRVAELHPRALTQPHPGGDDVDWQAYTPENPEFLVFTVNTSTHYGGYYKNDTRAYKRTTEPYMYLGRVKQHYHRYYDVLVRADLNVPPLPPAIVINHAGRYKGSKKVGEAGP